MTIEIEVLAGKSSSGEHGFVVRLGYAMDGELNCQCGVVKFASLENVCDMISSNVKALILAKAPELNAQLEKAGVT